MFKKTASKELKKILHYLFRQKKLLYLQKVFNRCVIGETVLFSFYVNDFSVVHSLGWTILLIVLTIF